jgi:hypothetical protein
VEGVTGVGVEEGQRVVGVVKDDFRLDIFPIFFLNSILECERGPEFHTLPNKGNQSSPVSLATVRWKLAPTLFELFLDLSMYASAVSHMVLT